MLSLAALEESPSETVMESNHIAKAHIRVTEIEREREKESDREKRRERERERERKRDLHTRMGEQRKACWIPYQITFSIIVYPRFLLQ